MAFLLAPYNEAMRLGMGFNTFTQQLCVSDSVKLAGGKEAASEQALHPQDKLGTMTAADGSSAGVSQEVTWNIKFVDSISDVTNGLNVSSSHQIKCDAIGGGGSASASFVDINRFKESDINYLIQVKVTNQRLVSPNLTEFCPIKNVPASEFTRVYGDSFISGFTEGGEFNALVSIKLRDRSKAKEIMGQLKVELDFKAASVQGEGKVANQDSEKSIDGETTIVVSWRGGGGIKNETITDWTLETLKAVAMEFPEHVRTCPLRTNAILTKYTSLKSFYESSPLKGSPLDYENAGVYSSTLLDAYIDYKVMWRNIQTTLSEVEQGQSELVVKADIPELSELSREANAYYEKQLAIYKKEFEQKDGTTPSAAKAPSVESDASDRAWEVLPSTTTTGSADAANAATKKQMPSVKKAPPEGPEPPMPPNKLQPYKASIFGLDKARRDCRFEMIKIIREVDAVAEDPKVACDPDRTWQYLSPSIFRMLLPTVRKLEKEKAAQKAAEEAKLATEATAKALEVLNNELTQTKRKLEATEEQLRAKERTVNDLIPYGGFCPVPLDTPVRFRSFSTKKCLDFYWDEGRGGKSVHIWDALGTPNQKWIISRAGAIGFYIRHQDSNRFLATGNTGGEGSAFITTSEFGNVFTFENRNDGTVFIHLADKNQYTMNPEGGKNHNGTKNVMWPHGKGDNDRWYIKRFEDYSM
ncbi:hypothetical protein K435DRAFT_345614 [Dendrothele bispora CBS 962.96]|uniref:Ricin B lectin domain-containing protein n=1 Tax=Dendrothele bispora (strain CBS 962.96) TaxID=1314807 RepID=A0A4S8MJF8_DENBC|nr:hypothetical protein K435DRAFT_345614 [Dendrothele bispora CBS 962.96]